MKLKKIWKCLGIATIIPATITTACCLSACSSKEEDSSLDSIKIVSNVTDLQVNLGDSIVSSEIVAKGYDQDGTEVSGLTYKIVLTDETGNKLPSWISVNNRNQICVDYENSPGSWVVHAQAVNTESRVKSDYRSLRISVVDPTSIPDKISIDCPDSIYVLSPTIKHIPIGLLAYKNNKISYECNKNCHWEISSIESLSKPEVKTDFVLDDYGGAASLYSIVTTNIGSTGDYNVTITAQSVMDSSIITTKTILVQVVSGSIFIDETTGFVYQRKNEEGATWRLTEVPEQIVELAGVRDEIYGIPVTEVKSNICASSPFEENYLVSIDFPESITKIGDSAFVYQTKLMFLSMPGVKEVGKNAFRECELVRFSQSTSQPKLEFVDDYAFFNCPKIVFDLPQPLKKIGSLSYHLTGITSMTIDADLESIGLMGFGDVSNLQTLTIFDETPAITDGNIFNFFAGNFKILVPTNAVSAYKEAPGWSTYSNYIQGF